MVNLFSNVLDSIETIETGFAPLSDYLSKVKAVYDKNVHKTKYDNRITRIQPFIQSLFTYETIRYSCEKKISVIMKLN